MKKSVSSRWCVEVLTAGETSSKLRYCVEAQRWRSALNRARELAGHSGSSSSFTVERRQGGYRVNDPSGLVSYVISKAPPGVPLTVAASKSARSPAAGSSSLSSTVPPVVEEPQPGSSKFRRLFRIFSTLRPPLRVSRGSRHRSAPIQSSPESLPSPERSVADADVAPEVAPSSPWASSPFAALARPGEYLIGKLFEQMHGLHFMPDLVSGATFVADVLAERIPCAGLLVHVFDINRREFIVVRAKGPRDQDVLLHRSGDSHPIFSNALRREAVFHVNPREQEGFDSVRWNKLGIVVNDLLCGPVHHGRRYLGVIELANPLTDRFSEAQAHALEYVCTQFADFVASRPVVIDEEAVLAGRSNAGEAG